MHFKIEDVEIGNSYSSKGEKKKMKKAEGECAEPEE